MFEKTIQIKMYGGLCNKLRMLYPYLQYSIKNNFSLKALWHWSSACTENFDTLFNPHPNLQIVYNDYDIIGDIDYSGCNVPKKIEEITDYSTCYLLFNPKSYIREAINTYLLSINNIAYNAVHIRRTDHTSLAKQHKRFTDDNVFFDYIYKSDLPVYVATDCIDMQNKLINIFTKKILFYEKIQPTDQLRQTSIANAIIDIIICSLSNDFLGSGYSSFSAFIVGLKTCGFKLNAS